MARPISPEGRAAIEAESQAGSLANVFAQPQAMVGILSIVVLLCFALLLVYRGRIKQLKASDSSASLSVEVEELRKERSLLQASLRHYEVLYNHDRLGEHSELNQKIDQIWTQAHRIRGLMLLHGRIETPPCMK